jgi:hypothetical protein
MDPLDVGDFDSFSQPSRAQLTTQTFRLSWASISNRPSILSPGQADIIAYHIVRISKLWSIRCWIPSAAPWTGSGWLQSLGLCAADLATLLQGLEWPLFCVPARRSKGDISSFEGCFVLARLYMQTWMESGMPPDPAELNAVRFDVTHIIHETHG